MRFFKYFCLALLFCAPARAEDTTLQEALDNIDDWLGVLRVIYTQGAGATAVESAGWTWLDPTEQTAQSTFDFIDTEGPFLPGTNIVGATYNAGTLSWDLDIGTSPVGLHPDNYYRAAQILTSSTDGGASTSGSWFTRSLNAELNEPTNSFATLNSDTVTVSSGVYWVEMHAPIYESGAAVTRGKVVSEGVTSYYPGPHEHVSGLDGSVDIRPRTGFFIVVPDAADLNVEQRVQTSKDINGLGRAASFTDSTYAVVEIWRVGEP